MISKELLSEVLGINITHISMCKGDNDLFFVEEKGGRYINIYELANKCKEWALEQGYLIGLNARQGVTLIDIETNRVLRYISFDNLEQVIRFELNLCQWILYSKKEGN